MREGCKRVKGGKDRKERGGVYTQTVFAEHAYRESFEEI